MLCCGKCGLGIRAIKDNGKVVGFICTSCKLFRKDEVTRGAYWPPVYTVAQAEALCGRSFN